MASDYLTEAQNLVKEKRVDLAKGLIKSGEVMLRDRNCVLDMSDMLTNLNEMIELYLSLQKAVEDMKLVS
jgi:hypothetical protein